MVTTILDSGESDIKDVKDRNEVEHLIAIEATRFIDCIENDNEDSFDISTIRKLVHVYRKLISN